MKYNLDQHWSAAFYRGLDALQLNDGTDILNINCDDQAGRGVTDASIAKTCRNIIQMSRDAATNMETNRICLPKIIKCLWYLA